MTLQSLQLDFLKNIYIIVPVNRQGSPTYGYEATTVRNLSDFNRTCTYNHLVCKRTLKTFSQLALQSVDSL